VNGLPRNGRSWLIVCPYLDEVALRARDNGSVTTSARRSALDLRWAIAIFIVAFALRLLYVIWFQPNPTDDGTTDAYFYHHSAEAMAAGRGYIFAGRGPAPTAHWPPGYTAVLSSVYLLPGPNLIMGKLLNVVLGAVTCVMVYVMGRVLWKPSVGIVGGLSLALYPSHIFYSALILTETVYAALITGIMLLFVLAVLNKRAEHRFVAFGLGLLLGAAAMVRGEGILLAVLFATVLWYSTRQFVTAARFAGLALVGTALIGCGWTVRNAIQLDAFVPINTGSSVVLSLGHWEGADGGGNRLRSAYIQRYYQELNSPEREVKAHTKRTREALQYWATHPGHEAELVPRRLIELYRHDHDAIDWAPQEGRTVSESNLDRLSLLSDVYYFVMLAAAGVGLVLWWRQDPVAAILLGGLILYLSIFIGLVFFGDQRYHAVLVPAFALLSAPALVAGLRTLRQAAGHRSTAP